MLNHEKCISSSINLAFKIIQQDSHPLYLWKQREFICGMVVRKGEKIEPNRRNEATRKERNLPPKGEKRGGSTIQRRKDYQACPLRSAQCCGTRPNCGRRSHCDFRCDQPTFLSASTFHLSKRVQREDRRGSKKLAPGFFLSHSPTSIPLGCKI